MITVLDPEVLNIAPLGRLVLTALVAESDPDGVVQCGRQRLARLTGLSISAIDRHLAVLTEAGHVDRLKRGGGRGVRGVYRVPERFLAGAR